MRHRIGIRELRDSLSKWVDRVKEGDEVVVTDHGKPVAVLSAVPTSVKARTEEEHIARLVAEGKLIPSTRPFQPWEPLVIPGADLAKAIEEDREERDLFLDDRDP